MTEREAFYLLIGASLALLIVWIIFAAVRVPEEAVRMIDEAIQSGSPRSGGGVMIDLESPGIPRQLSGGSGVGTAL